MRERGTRVAHAARAIVILLLAAASVGSTCNPPNQGEQACGLNCTSSQIVVCGDECKTPTGAVTPCNLDPCDPNSTSVCDPGLGLTCLIFSANWGNLAGVRCGLGKPLFATCNPGAKILNSTDPNDPLSFDTCQQPLYCRSSTCPFGSGAGNGECSTPGGIGAQCDSTWVAPSCFACEPGLACAPDAKLHAANPSLIGYCERPCVNGPSVCPCNADVSYLCGGANGNGQPPTPAHCCVACNGRCDVAPDCCDNAKDPNEICLSDHKCGACVQTDFEGCQSDADCCEYGKPNDPTPVECLDELTETGFPQEPRCVLVEHPTKLACRHTRCGDRCSRDADCPVNFACLFVPKDGRFECSPASGKPCRETEPPCDTTYSPPASPCGGGGDAGSGGDGGPIADGGGGSDAGCPAAQGSPCANPMVTDTASNSCAVDFMPTLGHIDCTTGKPVCVATAGVDYCAIYHTIGSLGDTTCANNNGMGVYPPAFISICPDHATWADCDCCFGPNGRTLSMHPGLCCGSCGGANGGTCGSVQLCPQGGSSSTFSAPGGVCTTRGNVYSQCAGGAGANCWNPETCK